ncbi:paraflagellar rod protein [Leishmania donovani]|uniref:Paraflagellar_rod_protein_-_putative n=4 Tax=Leishmania donovani species complex TaxID=38574 RepID=A0A6L0WHU9_LEIIN|nr:putative paraflagellar rod protein [Leishmania infantum JPCM5]CAC9444047.1 paraflagellar_rod_protein_-_putative [Leishmania infantum]CAJ1986064.1 paraflagellar rod protein [Leishmania donovani]CAM65402.1 putative paraflagellar rod protein [Leishmania infantum JPCM5]SUZ39013.1 paraflagellar_rod_protein_-_putative [Leishmania infantum]VDZ41966.1 paraflagellar_rod_protein_putative/GeneDB:LmjF.05.0920 [Leishmania donovani]|eukprot:XP_001463055.1 putative paraflagellar rod protein [Leishmania infantum JPCM5]
MLLSSPAAAAPNASGGGSGGAAAGDEVVSPTLETSTALSTAHAQLVLLEYAIRAAAASAVPSDASAQSHRKASEATRTMSATVGSQNSLLPGPVPAESGSPTSIMAATRLSSVTATAPSGASERLSALHDNLRRVRRLMQQYEEASQRVIKVHLLPSSETGEETLGSVATPTAHAVQRTKEVTPQQPSVSVAAAAAAADRPFLEQHSSNSANVASSGKPAAEQQNTLPSLHQRRALASDAVFTRFCGLRVTPDQLLLPLPPPATPTASPASPEFAQQRMSPRGIDDDAEEKKSGNGSGLVSHYSEPVKKRGSNNKTSSSQMVGSRNAKAQHSSASSSPRHSPVSRTAQQRKRTSAEAVLEEYAKLFYRPSATAASPPAAPSDNTKVTKAGSLSSSTPTDDGEVAQPLQETQQQFAALQLCHLFAYEAHLRSAAALADSQGKDNDVSTITRGITAVGAATTGAQVDDISWQHIPVAVQHMQDSLTALQARFTRDSHYASCGGQPIALVHQLQTWTQPLIQNLNELLSNSTLEETDENTREKLRRMKFDAEELQQAQAQAISNGDMQRSEELYYEQASLAEAMAGPYDELEAIMRKYGEVCVDAPLTRVLEQRDLLTTRLTRVIEEHTSKLSEVTLDAERVKEKRRAVAQARHRQRNNMSTYNHTWKKAWQTNSDQQMACYRAMEQLEKQLNDLQQAQSFLVDDWISHVTQERQREADAASFACFADARAAALAETQRNLQTVVDGVRQYSGAVQFSCRHVEAFVREVLRGHLSHSQVALRKDRLEQFRALYLTLGDLRFKKARNAEEIEKKIEYYTLQQEVAMDALNPKAKEFSKTKQRYEAAKAEVQKQIDQIDQRSRLQLERFRPTEQLLREAGVDFVSPEEELARRTQQRSQKLLEYQKLIEDGIGVRPTSSAASRSPATLTTVAASQATTSSTRTEGAKGLTGTNAPSPPRLQAVGSLHSCPRPPSAGEAANPTATASGALCGKNGRQLPPLRRMNHTYPPSQRTDHSDGSDEPTATTTEPSPQGANQTSTAATAAAAPTAASLSSLHATEERIMQGISKMAVTDRGRTHTSSGAASIRCKRSKR